MFGKLILNGVVLALGLQATSALANCQPAAAQSLERVGQTRLSVWFWDVYDAELLTDTGVYDDYHRRALRLSYLRDIKAKDLVETTEDEWRRLGISVSAQHQQWLASMQRMWPDVGKGDCLILVETEQGFSEFYNAQGQLGAIESPQFTDDFLAIWLSPESRFKSERNALIGANK